MEEDEAKEHMSQLQRDQQAPDEAKGHKQATRRNVATRRTCWALLACLQHLPPHVHRQPGHWLPTQLPAAGEALSPAVRSATSRMQSPIAQQTVNARGINRSGTTTRDETKKISHSAPVIAIMFRTSSRAARAVVARQIRRPISVVTSKDAPAAIGPYS